ncbi:hypothetical protein C0J26_07535 [Pseudomonas baetica]|uniref:hypothetical protein n=1 Tax=Pseudomonas baetica TaxID=674054 RepID=UPI000C2C06A5|nr:hypothetical protein [Pseudomonas baetica]PTC19840.1 hypothetical protein C0J26_07535 [Pseudomonas baetica]
MNKLFANLETGECYLRAVTNESEESIILHYLPCDNYNIVGSEDCFTLVKINLELCVEGKLELSTDSLESVLDIAITADYNRTLEVIRESFYEHDEIIKIILSETKYSKLASKLVRKSDKAFAANNVKRMNLNDKQIFSELLSN